MHLDTRQGGNQLDLRFVDSKELLLMVSNECKGFVGDANNKQ
jgi:hypothetical protein